MDDDDDLFEVDLDMGRLHVFEAGGDHDTTDALRQAGVHATLCRLGSELMAAAQDGRVSGVLVGHGSDPELRELFMRAFRGRFPSLPVVYVTPDAENPGRVAEMRAEGAALVLPWPLPDSQTLLSTLESVFPVGPVPVVPTARPLAEANETVVVEQDLLARKVSGLERATLTPSPVTGALEQAVRESAERSAENTELRSELTIANDRRNLLEERIHRLSSELSALTAERDQLKAKLTSPQYADHRGENTNARLAAVENLVAGVETYGWGLEQAIQYLEDLKHKVGARAPSLDVHLRSLKLLKAMLEKLREKMTG